MLKLDLKTGTILDRYEVEDGQSHFFGDLILHPNGKIFITDSIYPAIYVIDEEHEAINLFKQFEDLRSLQGITVSPEEGTIFFADYVHGIFRLDVDTGIAAEIDPIEGLSLKGIDGLYFHNSSLIAIQNGVRPMRITRLFLDDSGTVIRRFEYLEKNNPVLDEPTLGTIIDGTFYYVANSPWGKYSRDGEMWPLDKLERGVILKSELN